IKQRRVPMRISLRPEIIRVVLANVCLRRGVVLFRGSDLGHCELKSSPGLRHCDLVIARVNLDQQFAGLHPVVVLDMDPDDGAVNAGAEGIYMSVDLRVVGGFVRLQIVPCERGDRSNGENKQHQQYNSFGYATGPRTSTRRAGLSSRPIRQFDPALENFVGISAQGFQWIAQIGPLVQIRRAGSQIATALAVRELHFAVISNAVVHLSGPCACIYKVRTRESSPFRPFRWWHPDCSSSRGHQHGSEGFYDSEDAMQQSAARA